MDNMLDIIKARRSCKSFKPDSIPMELVDKVVEAGLYAASGKNKQSPIVLAVTNKEIRDRLEALNAKYDAMGRKTPFYNAPVVLVVLAPKSFPTCVYDGSLVMGNMLLEASTLGIGSCWIHRAKEAFEDPEGIEILRSLGIEEEYEGIGNCVLGYPEVQNTNILPRREGRVFHLD